MSPKKEADHFLKNGYLIHLQVDHLIPRRRGKGVGVEVRVIDEGASSLGSLGAASPGKL